MMTSRHAIELKAVIQQQVFYLGKGGVVGVVQQLLEQLFTFAHGNTLAYSLGILMSATTRKRFIELASEARACQICPDLRERAAVLSELNGSLDPKLFFIAEAPGRQGADRTRIPFSGDRSGENFRVLLGSIGLERKDIFVTNAVMCSPRTATDANRKPTRAEIKNCSSFLSRQIELIQPKIVVTIGGVALEALKAIEYHEFTLKNDAAKILGWNNRTLVPLYHPSPQVVITVRRMPQQLEDFQVLKALIA
jgi:uracil-DNA glycosylase family 4